MTKTLIDALKNTREYQVYRDGEPFKKYRVAPESIKQILKILNKTHDGSFEAVDQSTKTRIICA